MTTAPDPTNAERIRRNTKGNFTRAENSFDNFITSNRPYPEVKASYHYLVEKFEIVEAAHNSYCELLDDNEYSREESWMYDIQTRKDKARAKLEDYKSKCSDVGSSSVNSGNRACIQTEKIPLPEFSGRVEDYLCFKKDWREIVECRYGSDCPEILYLLKKKVSKDAAKWLVPVTDYQEAWRLLDDQYNDARLISDDIIGQIEKFRPLLERKDSRLCDLYHLVQKAYSIVKELDREADLNNSTCLSLLEKKLHIDDREEWFHYQRKNSVVPGITTFLSWINDILWIRKMAGMELRSTPSARYRSNNVEHDDEYMANLMQGPGNAGFTRPKCWVCENLGHSVETCAQFLVLIPDERLKRLKVAKACHFCLGRHTFPCMRKKIKCCGTAADGSPCVYHHHPLLHGATFENPPPPNPAVNTTGQPPLEDDVGAEDLEGVGSETISVASTTTNSEFKMLPILTANAINSQTTRTRRANILLDSGSEVTLIRQEFAQKLGLEGEPVNITLTLASGQDVAYQSRAYKLQLQGLDPNLPRIDIDALEIPQITRDTPELDLKVLAEKLDLDMTKLHRNAGPIDVLVGIDKVEFTTGNTVVKENLAYRETVLGIVFYGVQTRVGDSSVSVVINNLSQSANSFYTVPDLERFWTIESMGTLASTTHTYRRELSPLDHEVTEKLRHEAKRVNQQWCIPLPWKKDPYELPNNYPQVAAKLESTEKRLRKVPAVAQMYDQQIRDLVDAGSARILSSDELRNHHGPVHYISHHAVMREDKPSHPCRVVFNLAAKFKGNSLNDYIHQGGDHLNDLIGVILRWRENEVALVGDISKMFHQILIDPGIDSNTHRFLWRNLDGNRRPDIYAMNVLTFGNVASPTVANLALDLTAETFGKDEPAATNTILNCRYMDDICESVQSTDQAAEMIASVNKILTEGHFKIKSWSSNRLVQGSERTVDIEKVLGVLWYVCTDTIAVSVKLPKKYNIEAEFSKRAALCAMASAFDVLGMAAPVIVRGKILMQVTWTLGVEWDETLPRNQQENWRDFVSDLLKLSDVDMPRCVTPPTAIGLPMLVSFCDSSESAFGAVLYLRWELEDGTYAVRFLIGKSRVAPLKQITLARLELQSALMAARLVGFVLKQLRLKISGKAHFTDSMIALSWIQNQSKLFPTFIANRVGEIQSETDPKDWTHIPSRHNVADDISRGLRPDQLKLRYLSGPRFLQQPREGWPDSAEKKLDLSDPALEAKKSTTTAGVRVVKVEFDLPALADYQPWKKVVRITATIKRYIELLRRLAADTRGSNVPARNTRAQTTSLAGKDRYPLPPNRYGLDKTPLSADELMGAEITLIKMSQSQLKKLSEYASLAPYTDAKGLVRVGGRIPDNVATYNERHPLLLPYNWMSKLIVEHMHKFGHPASATLAARVRKTFWIVGLKRMAKSVVFKCLFCRELNASFEQQYMANLPTESLNPSPPFYNCSCDLFGPKKVLISKYKTANYYGVLFTCLATGALHGDIMDDYSGRSFMQTFRRFISIRGAPNSVLSDQGSQIVNASKDIVEWSAQRQIKWRLTTATAAHHNGRIESLVKSVKRTMDTIIGAGPRRLTALEFLTVVQDSVNIVNERPIGLLPTDPGDGPYISPNDIILGRSGLTVPRGEYDQTVDPFRRLQFCQRLVDDWWNKWKVEVFPLLVPRKKWQSEKRDVKVGDYVVLSDPQPVYGRWTKGRVIQTFPGKDNKIRSVEVKTSAGTYQRPITKVAVLLPIEEQ